MDSRAFIESVGRAKNLQPVYVLHGDEAFLKRRALESLRARVFGSTEDQWGFSTHAGDAATFAVVVDELQTAPFLGPRRLVVVQDADPFVTRYRDALGRLLAQPPSTGVLALNVRSWPAATRLAKLLPPAATIACKAVPPHKLPEWCVAWASLQYQKKLSTAAARALVDLAGPEMGILDQELAKLAAYCGHSEEIDARAVDEAVGGSRAAKIFKVFDALAAGRPAEALGILDATFEQGEEPIRILGAFSLQLRRLARAASLIQRGRSAAQAVDEAGFPPFARQGSLQQLQSLGPRTSRLYDWLLETDLGLKGSSQLPARLQLERLVLRLFAQREEMKGA